MKKRVSCWKKYVGIGNSNIQPAVDCDPCKHLPDINAMEKHEDKEAIATCKGPENR